MAQRRGAQRRSSGEDRKGGDFGDDGDLCDCWDVDGIGMDKRHKCTNASHGHYMKKSTSVSTKPRPGSMKKKTCVARLGELLGLLGRVVGKYSGNLIIIIGYRDHC